MFKFASAKNQSSSLFVVAVVMNILCSNLLGVYGVTPPPHGPPPCSVNCSEPYEPICASDGKTYGNLCHLNKMANVCFRANATVVHNGTCLHQHCVPQPKNPLTCDCLCSLRCSNILRPVCGTDGFTYQNACKLAYLTACGYHPVRVCHKGLCKPGDRIYGDALAKE